MSVFEICGVNEIDDISNLTMTIAAYDDDNDHMNDMISCDLSNLQDSQEPEVKRVSLFLYMNIY